MGKFPSILAHGIDPEYCVDVRTSYILHYEVLQSPVV